MATINTFNKNSMKKISRAVKQVTTTPLRSSMRQKQLIARGGSGGSTSTYLAKIKTYTAGTGVYTVDIYSNGYNEDATETDIKATPTITTFTPLGIGEKAIVMKDEIETLGDNES